MTQQCPTDARDGLARAMFNARYAATVARHADFWEQLAESGREHWRAAADGALAFLAAQPAESFLEQLRRVNAERYGAWVGDTEDAGMLFDAAELGGEVGELLNVVKKLDREERGWRGSRAGPKDFEDECADVLICLDKLARRRGVDLAQATVRKFNATSDKVGLPQKLTYSADAGKLRA